MNKAVELLKEERKELIRTIKWIEPEISYNTGRIEELSQEGHAERLREHYPKMWSDKWTPEDFIKTNLESHQRSLNTYTEKKKLAEKELEDIKTALSILKKNGIC